MMTFREWLAMREGLWLNDKQAVAGRRRHVEHQPVFTLLDKPASATRRHQSPMTTDRYINFAQQINPAVESLYVPEVIQAEGA